jgi:hypothetical protein
LVCGCGGGLEGGDDGGFGGWGRWFGGWGVELGGFGGFVVFAGFGGEALHEEADEGLLSCGGDFRAWGEDAVGGVDGDLFDGSRFVGGFGGGLDLWQVEAGDLEAVEEESGAAGVDVVGGDALEDLADGGLDGGAVFGQGQVEGGATTAALGGVCDGLAGGVVVVTKFFLAEAWAGATASVGEDVAALILLGGGRCGVLHGVVPYPGKSVQSLQKKRPASGLPGAGLRLK